MGFDRMRVVLSGIFLLIAGSFTSGQQQSTSDTLFVPSGWETIDASECNARFRLPAGYKYESRDVDAYGRKLKNHAYLWSSSNAQLSVSCGVHPFYVDDRDTLSILYDQDLSEPFTNPTSENLVATDIIVGGHPARQLEFARANGKAYLRVWVMLVGEIRFQIAFGTWKDEKALRPKVEAIGPITAFFNSVSFLKAIPPISKSYQESLPPGYLGEVEQRKYVNKPFGYSLDLPAGWTEYSTADIQKFIEDESGKTTQAQAMRRTRVTLYSSRGRLVEPSLPAFMIVIEKQDVLNASPKSAAELNKKNVTSDGSFVVVNDVAEEVIGSKTFATFTVKKPTAGLMLFQTSYIVSIDNYTVTFNLQYLNESDLDQLLAIMRSIRFTGSKRN